MTLPTESDLQALRARLKPDTRRLQGTVALVCGGDGEIGAWVALALAWCGAHVYATGVSSQAGTGAPNSIAAGDPPFEYLQGDCGDAGWFQTTLDRIRSAHGRLHLLVLDGGAPPSRLRFGPNTSTEQTAYVAANLRLVQTPLGASLELLENSQGAVVQLSSSLVQDVPAGFSHYAAFKQGGEALVRAAHQEAPRLLACIARVPERLQTGGNAGEAGMSTAISPIDAAAAVVNDLGAHWGSTGVSLLSEFPALAVAEPAKLPARGDEPAFPVRVAATFTTDPLMPPLAFWLRTLGAGEEIETAPYGQVLQSLLDPGSVLSGRGGLNVVLFRVHDWLHELPEETRESLEFLKPYLADAAADFERAMQAHRARAGAPTLLLVCPARSTASREVAALVEETEARLCAALGTVAGLHIAFARDYHERYGVDEAAAADPLRESIAHIPYKDAYYDTLATVIARWVHRQRTPARKVVVVDCDNTLWGGVVGEVGAEGIAIEPHHLALHDALRTLGRSGVLICLCSKNEEADVWSVFDTRTDMRLKREDVVAATINWQPKSGNLRSLASRLNLGLDSFVFIDDNPVECAEVRAHCPEVLTLEWPQDPVRARQLLAHAWELEPRGATAEDERRTQMYREEFKRQELRTQTLSFADFIGSLEVDIQVQPLSAADLKRASQLTLRTNQFNFTTRRRDEGEMQRLLDAGAHDVRTVRVKDRFGDYGLVGLLIAEHQPDAVFADTFLLSCRVLGRGVEHRMAAELGRIALARGVNAVRLRVDPTKRNAPARTFLMSFAGAEPAADGVVQSEMDAATLAEFRYVPTEQDATAADLANDAPASAAAALPVDRIRDREALISRIAFELSDPLRLRAAVEGRSTATVAQQAAASDVDDAVYAAFAATLRVPADTIRTVDRLEALGCDSLKIVAITVALLERYPSLPTTLLFEHKAVSDIIRHVRALLSPETSARSVPEESVTDTRAGAAPDAALDIAVVGMNVRCGGADSPAELWALLSEARSAVGPVPAARQHFLHPLNDSRPYWASLLADPGRFDAEFFGVSPREAEYMDPQLRLFLEVAWGALEDAGCVGADHDPDTGVFAGVMYADYAHRANIRGSGDNAYRCWEGFSLANRLSQLLGFRGPSLAVDTACSSSGTAMHFACRALAAGDCRVAIVGGVNLILDPDRFSSLGHLGILSPRGKCEPFGADADGTALGEGAGVVVLRPLADAVRRGDRIYGVIKGTGVSTGSGTVGFTAPNPQAQAQAIERSLRAARVDPRTISYIEAHGTGTALGDPIEVRGLTLAYSKPELHDAASDVVARRTIGSIKPNIGHLEAGAAVVGLIKVLLQLQWGMLLPSITSPSPNPQIPFDGTLDVQRAVGPWSRPTATVNGVTVTVPRRAGVSSFGVGGANAHIIVEEAPAGHERAVAADRSQHLLTLSATSETALDEQVRRVRRHVENDPAIAAADLAFSMNVGREHFGRRVTIRFSDREQLLASLDELSRGATPKRSTRSDVSGRSAPKVAFLFTGQGSQYAGMGKQLYDTQPVFRAALDRCAAIFDRLLGEPLRELLFASEDSGRLDQTGFTQPALFAFEYALSELWRSWGVRPDVVMGHSVGEIGAMCVAGGLSLEDGLTLIAARGRLMQALPAGGAMTSVMAPEALVADAIAGVQEQVTIAAINGPGQVVISGVGTVVADISARLEGAGIKTKPLTVSHAFHSPLMKPMLSEYEAVVRSIELRTPDIPFVSCVDGALVTSEVTHPEYWIRQIMDPVRFAAGMSVLERERVDAFVEIGPQPVLLGMGRQCVSDASSADWLPSLRKDVDSWTTLIDSVAALYARGATIDWKGFDAPYARTRVAAPTYAFTPKQYWLRMPALQPAAAQAVRVADDTTAAPARAAVAAGPSLYQVEWQPRPLADGKSSPHTPQRSAGDWVIFADRSGVGAELAAELTGAGARALVVVPGKRFERTWDGHYQVNPEGLDDLQKLWASIKREGMTSVSIAHLWSLDASPTSPGVVEDVVGVALVSAANLVRSIATATPAVRAAWFVTRGAMAPDAALLTDHVAVEQAPLWGLGRTIALEHPEVWGGLVDVSPGDDARRDVAALARELLSADGEDQIVLRGEARYVARLTPASSPAPGSIKISGDATYLITGGTGALGLHVAAWLVAHGAKHLMLVGRRPNKSATAAAEKWRQQGVDVTITNADVSSAVEVDRIIRPLANSRAPLRGIVHAAGVDSDAPLSALGRRELSQAHAAKALGAWMLHERTQQIPLDFFVCFSSIASIIGSQGHAHYGAANAYLDALILERRRLGLAGTGINWGPWAGGGMAAPEQLERFRRIGNLPLDPGAAVDILGQLIGTPASGTVVADIDWPKFRDIYEARRRRPLIANLVDGISADAQRDAEITAPGAVAAARPAASTAPWVDLLRNVPEAERLDRLHTLLRTEVAAALGLERADDVRVDRTLYQMGMDSLMMAGFIGRLRELVGVSCTAIVFDHPQVPALAARLLEQLPLAEAGAVAVADVAVAAVPSAVAAAQVMTAATPAPAAGSAGPAPSAATPSERRTGIEGYSKCSEPEIIEFQKVAFPDRRPESIAERWRWMFVRSAERLGIEPRVWLYREENQLAGQMGAIPVRLKAGRDSLDTAWLVDTMVLQRYRHTAVGARLMVQAHDDLPFALSLGQTSEMREINFRLGWAEVAPLQVSQLLLRPERVLKGKLSAPAVWPAALGLRAWSSIRERGRGHGHTQARVHEIASFDTRHDALWERASRDLVCAVVRDASYLNWKYVDQPDQTFVRLELTERNALLGSAVLMLREPDAAYAYRRAFLVDLVAPLAEASVLDALLQGVSDTAARHDADALVCLHIGEQLTRALKRAGFHQRKPTRFLLIDGGGLSQAQRDLVLSGANWFVTHGDSDIDRPGQ